MKKLFFIVVSILILAVSATFVGAITSDEVTTLVEQTTHWAPKVGSVIFIFFIFFILAKVMKRIIIKGTERLELDRHLILLLARTSSITLIIFGFINIADSHDNPQLDDG